MSLADNDGPAVTTPVNGICDRTSAVRDYIMVMLRYVHGYYAGCAEVTAAHLAKIRNLQIYDSGVGALEPGDFAGLTRLAELDLSSNALRTLPAGVFEDLSALTELDLSSNDLDTLSAGVFDGAECAGGPETCGTTSWTRSRSPRSRGCRR